MANIPRLLNMYGSSPRWQKAKPESLRCLSTTASHGAQHLPIPISFCGTWVINCSPHGGIGFCNVYDWKWISVHSGLYKAQSTRNQMGLNFPQSLNRFSQEPFHHHLARRITESVVPTYVFVCRKRSYLLLLPGPGTHLNNLREVAIRGGCWHVCSCGTWQITPWECHDFTWVDLRCWRFANLSTDIWKCTVWNSWEYAQNILCSNIGALTIPNILFQLLMAWFFHRLKASSHKALWILHAPIMTSLRWSTMIYDHLGCLKSSQSPMQNG